MKRVFMFPGQGAQQIGMGFGFGSSDRIWKKADEIMGWPLSETVKNGPEEELSRTRVTQPAVYVTEIIIYNELRERGIAPDAAAGHSLGEYAAVAASGAFSWEDGLELVKFRGEIFEETAASRPGGMLAVIGLDEDKLSEAIAGLDGLCQIVNFNSPGQVVISAEERIIPQAAESIKAAGAKMVVPLKVSGGFHSSLMDDAVKPMREKLAGIELKDPDIVFYSNFTGGAVRTSGEIRDCLVRQVNSPVRWTDIVNNAAADLGPDALFLEAGPGKVLQGLMRRIDRRLQTAGVSGPGDLENL